ncbi:hypothetical protein [Mycobacteroides chelonae]|jgi:hypothetical protein|uniref:hypothetical protein n=1 Tax=Mycobacteroides chelonae TaxID=1774 RepID=UPI000A96E3E9|nr:hypothetical protein [Mycobacteroides chelonae]MBF9352145.1 hypothetical protein [Mycobacteroides chelonae]
MLKHDDVPTGNTRVLIVEADLTDWSEQHHAVALPDDEYPHTAHRHIATADEPYAKGC